jgi:hypothetical protein
MLLTTEIVKTGPTGHILSQSASDLIFVITNAGKQPTSIINPKRDLLDIGEVFVICKTDSVQLGKEGVFKIQIFSK